MTEKNEMGNYEYISMLEEQRAQDQKWMDELFGIIKRIQKQNEDLNEHIKFMHRPAVYHDLNEQPLF